MRAGRLKTRRYKVYHPGRKWFLLLAAALVLGISGFFLRTGRLPAFFAPAEPAAPHFSAAESTGEATLTLSGQRWYALQLGAFDTETAARELAQAFIARGAGGAVWAEGGAYRVLAAAYTTRADAQAVQSRLRIRHQVETTVTEIAWPEITLRVSGRTAQLNALADSLTALGQFCEQMGALSAALDQNDMGAAAAGDALRSHRETLAALRARLHGCFDESVPAAVSGLNAVLDDWIAALDHGLAAQGSTSWSARIKSCHLLGICRAAAYAAQLAGASVN